MTERSPPSDATPVRPTAEWLAQNKAKRLAYEEQRRRHAQAWHRTGEPDAEPDAPEPEGRPRRSGRGKIHDKRQDSFDL